MRTRMNEICELSMALAPHRVHLGGQRAFALRLEVLRLVVQKPESTEASSVGMCIDPTELRSTKLMRGGCASRERKRVTGRRNECHKPLVIR